MIAVVEANAMPNVEGLLRDHVSLQVDCVDAMDRLYLNRYVTLLSGQRVSGFCTSTPRIR